MQVQMKVSPTTIVTADGKTHVELFEQLAALQEVFSTVSKCGKCNSSDVKLVVREDDEDNKYYELHCQSKLCYARLAFGQNKGDKVGTLYPRRRENKKKSVMKGKLDAGEYLPDNGWLKWDKEKGKSF